MEGGREGFVNELRCDNGFCVPTDNVFTIAVASWNVII